MVPSQASHRARAALIVAPKPQLAGSRSGGRVDQVLGVDPHDHLGLVPAQDRQAACGEGVVAQLHECVGLLLGPGALIGGDPAGLHQWLHRGLELLPTHGVQLEPAGDRAVGVLGDH